MEILKIQVNCSECALVVYSDKLEKKQKELVLNFFKKRKLKVKTSKKGNLLIESDYEQYPKSKMDLWGLADDLEMISDWTGDKIKRETHFDLIRDESYDDMKENGTI